MAVVITSIFLCCGKQRPQPLTNNNERENSSVEEGKSTGPVRVPVVIIAPDDAVEVGWATTRTGSDGEESSKDGVYPDVHCIPTMHSLTLHLPLSDWRPGGGTQAAGDDYNVTVNKQ